MRRRLSLVLGVAMLACAMPGWAQEGEGVPPEFETVPNRWEIEPPLYGPNDPAGEWYDPYHQNVLKGDYPIIGNEIFFRFFGESETVAVNARIPVPGGVFTEEPFGEPFFGERDIWFVNQNFITRFELLKGSTAYRPFDWQLVVEPVFNINYISIQERQGLFPDTREGTDRLTTDVALLEGFAEIHLLDLTDNYDFLSVKLGRQEINTDFRGLIYKDSNDGVRLFGSMDGNRLQGNLLYFNLAERDTNSALPSWERRNQQVALANLYIQDFFVLGYVTEFSFLANIDDGTEEPFEYDKQGFLVRPDPVGIATPHDVEAYYLGWIGEGHLGRLNISHAFYQAFGRDSNNPIAGRPVDINGQFAFLELSVDVDWMRYQTSFVYSSGDSDPRDSVATGFDSVFDEQEIVGAEFSFWNNQTFRLADRGGVALVNERSVIPSTRSNKNQGQSNFVNPGLYLANIGATAELTPTLRLISNVNYLAFAETDSLEVLLKQADIARPIGVDISAGLIWRPLLNNNIILKGFGAVFSPLRGFRDIYDSATLFQAGTEVVLVF